MVISSSLHFNPIKGIFIQHLSSQQSKLLPQPLPPVQEKVSPQ